MFERLKKDEWIIAIRRKEDGFLQENGKNFKIVPNSIRYWCADPFLYKANNNTFLLFEMYDRLKGKGLLGYRVKKDGKFGKMNILFEDVGHLSYPFVFRYDDKDYIMPESNSQNICYCMQLFCEKDRLFVGEKHIIKNGKYVDTTLLEYNGKKYFFTTDILKGDNRSDLTIYDEFFQNEIAKKCVADATNARMGGAFFNHNGDVIRVSQDCSNGYGTGLNFSKCLIADDGYDEKLLKKISQAEIIEKSNRKFDGIHTYNFDDEYEVIDLKMSNKINLVRIFGYFLVKCGFLKTNKVTR